MTGFLAFTGGAPANGNALKLWRVAQGWTQLQAAEWYGTHERTWRRYEGSGKASVPDKLNKRIQEYEKLQAYQHQTGEAS